MKELLDELIQWDKSAFLYLNGSDSAYWDNFMWIVTKTQTWIPLLLVVLFVILKNSNFRRFLITLVGLALVILLADRISSGLVKPYFCRLRPTHDASLWDSVDTVFGYRGGLYGFVSSHAANTFAVFVYLSLIFRSRMMTAGLFCWALISSYSRIYLGVHYPGDIICGALLGLLVGGLVYWGCRFFSRRINEERQFYSNAYTASGYLYSDMHVLMLTLLATYCCIFIGATFISFSS